jgi:hypothetical protein
VAVSGFRTIWLSPPVHVPNQRSLLGARAMAATWLSVRPSASVSVVQVPSSDRWLAPALVPSQVPLASKAIART